jgi:hypothetical protein
MIEYSNMNGAVVEVGTPTPAGSFALPTFEIKEVQHPGKPKMYLVLFDGLQTNTARTMWLFENIRKSLSPGEYDTPATTTPFAGGNFAPTEYSGAGGAGGGVRQSVWDEVDALTRNSRANAARGTPSDDTDSRSGRGNQQRRPQRNEPYRRQGNRNWDSESDNDG